MANAVRGAIEAALAARGTELRGSALTQRLADETQDVTTPGRPIRRGTLHPSIVAMDEIAEIFGRFGFVVHESPEIEDDLTNFQMLNIPPDHPARDLWDTLYVDVPDHLLRTHTSPGQIRVMHETKPPIRALLPGRCFRYEAIDASHASEFFQVEGLMVDEGTTMADLKGLLEQFAHAMYGEGKRTRFRPGYYPFTEPSVAFDVECLVCGGVGCPEQARRRHVAGTRMSSHSTHVVPEPGDVLDDGNAEPDVTIPAALAPLVGPAADGGIDPIELAKEIEKLLARFPNAKVNADEQRQLRASLYRPLITLPKDARTDVVELIMANALS